jgi:hypothetical protein
MVRQTAATHAANQVIPPALDACMHCASGVCQAAAALPSSCIRAAATACLDPVQQVKMSKEA